MDNTQTKEVKNDSATYLGRVYLPIALRYAQEHDMFKRQFETEEEIIRALRPEVEYYRVYWCSTALLVKVVVDEVDHLYQHQVNFVMKAHYQNYLDGSELIVPANDFVGDMQNNLQKAVFTDIDMANKFLEDCLKFEGRKLSQLSNWTEANKALELLIVNGISEEDLAASLPR